VTGRWGEKEGGSSEQEIERRITDAGLTPAGCNTRYKLPDR